MTDEQSATRTGNLTLETAAPWRCENCRWWREDSWSNHDIGWKTCDLLTPGIRNIGESHPTPTPKAAVEGSLLHTAPDFGCVQWEGEG